MRILNFGSLNIDHVYRVDHFPQPGETVAAANFRTFTGGKGLNQSVALAAAGAQVFHAGKIGRDGTRLLDALVESGADTRNVSIDPAEVTGHAVIMVDSCGRNSIVIHGGANRKITPEDAAAVLDDFGPGDWLLLQNEISAVPDILRMAKKRGLTIAFNPAPMTKEVPEYPLSLIDWFIINEVEGAGLTGARDPGDICRLMADRYPHAATVLTLGEAGSLYSSKGITLATPAKRVEVVDTTAAGDTFIGYLLTEIMRHGDAARALAMATAAAAICVSRHGASASVPKRAEVEKEV